MNILSLFQSIPDEDSAILFLFNTSSVNRQNSLLSSSVNTNTPIQSRRRLPRDMSDWIDDISPPENLPYFITLSTVIRMVAIRVAHAISA